ncbi:MAG: HD domain-containing protein [Mycobacteriales bacterium]
MSVDRRQAWAATMAGHPRGGVVLAHDGPPTRIERPAHRDRGAREDLEDSLLAAGATRAAGAGDRARPEDPDPERTCFERDRDRILHSPAFRRLSGKTQVFVYPADHQRTRLTHALEVAQVATSIARAVGLNVALTEAIAIGHDCGHGPGGHASEEAFDRYLPGGYDHAPWGAVVLEPLNLCAQTLDGIANHSWSRPVPATPEGAVVSWADRCAYSTHDLEDAVGTGIVTGADLPDVVRRVAGSGLRGQLTTFIGAVVTCIRETGVVGMAPEPAAALAALRDFNYRRIYSRPESVAQGDAVIAVLRALVDYYAERPQVLPDFDTDSEPRSRQGRAGPAARSVPEEGSEAAVRAAVGYVAGMTDRYAFQSALTALGWDPARLPLGIDVPVRH